MGQGSCYHKFFHPSETLLALLLSVTLMQTGQAVNILVRNFDLPRHHYLNASEYYLAMQTDCDLVLYQGATAVLSSNTSGRGTDCSLKMLQDGDMAIYNSTRGNSPPLWSSMTNSTPDKYYFFVLTSNGSLYIFDFVNVTRIGSLGGALSPGSTPAPGALTNFSYPYDPHLAWKPTTPLDKFPFMPVGYYLDEGCSVQSLTKKFNLTLGYDCNLQSKELLQNGSARILWESKTTSFGPGHQCRLSLLEDGNLQIKTVGTGILVWASNVTGNVSGNWAVFVDHTRGDVIIHDLLNPGTILWNTANLPPTVDANGVKKKKQFPVTDILIGVITAVSVLAVGAVALIYYFAASAGIDEAEKELQRRLGSNKRKCKTLSTATIKQATRNFQTKIGHGGFGDVFYGKLACGQEIAVKVLSAKSHQSKQEFYNEVELLTVVHHKYLVALLGYCLARHHRYMLVYENMSGGDLRRRLQGDGSARNPLAWKERTAIILQIAEGIEYLHNKCSPAIIHRDIKSNNILLTKNLVAKVADFGLSKLRAVDQESATHVTTLVKGTPGYLDPEYHESGLLTEKSDVYAFGIVVMEILTGQHQYLLIEKVLEAWSSKQLEDLVDPYMMGDYDRDEFYKLVQLSVWCSKKKSVERPSMAVIVHQLQEITQVNILEAQKLEETSSYTSKSEDYEEDTSIIVPAASSSVTSMKSSIDFVALFSIG